MITYRFSRVILSQIAYMTCVVKFVIFSTMCDFEVAEHVESDFYFFNLGKKLCYII